MPRIVFIVLALFLMWRVLASLGRRRASGDLGADSYSRFSPRQRRRRLDLDDTAGASSPEELCKCQQCGTYVPRGRALAGDDGSVFCSQTCRSAFRERQPYEA